MKNEYYLRPEGNKIFMCCGKARCPSVSVDSDGLIRIEDDYGNSVKMKQDEASLISNAVNKLSHISVATALDKTTEKTETEEIENE